MKLSQGVKISKTWKKNWKNRKNQRKSLQRFIFLRPLVGHSHVLHAATFVETGDDRVGDDGADVGHSRRAHQSGHPQRRPPSFGDHSLRAHPVHHENRQPQSSDR